MESNQGWKLILSPQAWPACSSGAEGDESQAEKTQEESLNSQCAAGAAADMHTELQQLQQLLQQTRALCCSSSSSSGHVHWAATTAAMRTVLGRRAPHIDTHGIR